MKSNQIFLFFSRLFFVILVLVAVDFLLGKGLKSLYFSEEKGQHAQTTYSIDKANEDIIVFGSSRAVRHYDPNILAHNSTLSCYNAGRDAQKIPFYTAVEEVILHRKKPKLIILDVLPYELSVDDSKYSRLTILLPYCKTHPELVKYIQEVSPFEPYKLWSQTYPFNSTLFISAYNHLLKNSIPDTEHGYVPLERTLTPFEMADLGKRLQEYAAKYPDAGSVKQLDKKALDYYRTFLENARKAGVKTLVIISPSLFNEPDTYVKKELQKVAYRYPNAEFIDYSNDRKYTGVREKFADQFHLNKQGAEEFSKEINALLVKKSLLK